MVKNFSSCIDLIFTSQPNLVMDAGVRPSLHANCQHQIVYAKFNLKIQYPAFSKSWYQSYLKDDKEFNREIGFFQS